MELDRVARLAEEILPAERGEDIPRDYGAGEDDVPACRETERSMAVSMPLFLGGYKCRPCAGGEELLRRSLIGDMACDVLFGDSSPLYARLYEAGDINGSLGGNFDLMPGAAYLYVGGDARDPRRVFAAITAAARRLGTGGIDGAFYQRLRRAAYGQMVRSLNSFENIAIAQAEGVFHGYDYYAFPEVFASIDKADIEEFLRRCVTDERTAISLVTPRA